MTKDQYILRCRVPDGVGILAAVTGFIAERNGYIFHTGRNFFRWPPV